MNEELQTLVDHMVARCLYLSDNEWGSDLCEGMHARYCVWCRAELAAADEWQKRGSGAIMCEQCDSEVRCLQSVFQQLSTDWMTPWLQAVEPLQQFRFELLTQQPREADWGHWHIYQPHATTTPTADCAAADCGASVGATL